MQPGPGFQINEISGDELPVTGMMPCSGVFTEALLPTGTQPTALGLHASSLHGAVEVWPHDICFTTSKYHTERSISADQQATKSMNCSHTHFQKMSPML